MRECRASRLRRFSQHGSLLPLAAGLVTPLSRCGDGPCAASAAKFTKPCSKNIALSFGGSRAGRVCNTCCGLPWARRNRIDIFLTAFRNSCHERRIPRPGRRAAREPPETRRIDTLAKFRLLPGAVEGLAALGIAALRWSGQQPGRAGHAGLSQSASRRCRRNSWANWRRAASPSRKCSSARTSPTINAPAASRAPDWWVEPAAGAGRFGFFADDWRPRNGRGVRPESRRPLRADGNERPVFPLCLPAANDEGNRHFRVPEPRRQRRDGHFDRHGLLRPHAGAVGRALAAGPSLRATGDLPVTSTTRWKTRAWLGGAWPRPSATARASSATDACCPWTNPWRRWRSTSRAAPVWSSRAAFAANMSENCPRNWCRTSSNRSPDAPLRPAHDDSAGKKRAPQDRGIFKGLGRCLRRACVVAPTNAAFRRQREPCDRHSSLQRGQSGEHHQGTGPARHRRPGRETLRKSPPATA